MKVRQYILGIILCLIATVAWGAMFPIMAPTLKLIDPVYFTLLRYGSVAIIFAILLLLIEGKSAFNPGKRFWKLWLLGTFAFAGFNLLVFAGQNLAGKSGSVIASVMMAIQPLITALISWLFKGKKLNLVTIFTMFLAFIGVFLVVTKGNPKLLFQGGSGLAVATLLIFLADLCWVLFTMGGSEFKDWSILRYSTLTTIYGVISVAILTVIFTIFGVISLPKVETLVSIRGALAYMIIFAGVIAVFAWNLGNKYLGPVNGILFMNIEPVTSFIVVTMSGYLATEAEIIGCILTIVALIINNVFLRFQTEPKEVREEVED